MTFNQKLQTLLHNYHSYHLNPVNQMMHAIAILFIVVAGGSLFFGHWVLSLVFFSVGFFLLMKGHDFEGNKPASKTNPIYILIAPLWLFYYLPRHYLLGQKNKP